MPLFFGKVGLNMEGVFFDMDNEPWICDVCRKDIPPGPLRATNAKSKRRFIRHTGMDCDKICCGCSCRIARTTKRRPSGMTLSGVAKIITSLKTGFCPKEAMERSMEIADWVASSEGKIRMLLKELNAENQSLNTLKIFNVDLSRALGDYLWRSYPERRKRADITIAKPELRLMVFSRDGWMCIKCQRTDNLSVDHIIPVAKNGTDEFENLQTLCRSCNSKKGASN